MSFVKSEQFKKIILQIGAWAGILAAVIFRKNWAAEFQAIFRHIPGLDCIPAVIPEDPEVWFSLIQEQPFMALVYLDFFDIINYGLIFFLFISLYLTLKEEYPKIMLGTLTTGIVGIIAYIVANPALRMFRLSKNYQAASTAAEQSSILAQAEALLSLQVPGANIRGIVIYCGQFCFALAGLLFAIYMIRSEIFPRWKGIVGIIAHGLLLLSFVLLIVPEYSFIPIVLAATFLLVWHFSAGRTILKEMRKNPFEKVDRQSNSPLS